MVAKTPDLLLPYPEDNDSPDGAGQMAALAAALDACSLIPSVASDVARTAAHPTPTEGVAVYRTDLLRFQVYYNGAWRNMGSRTGMDRQGIAWNGSTVQDRPAQGWMIKSGNWTGVTDSEGYLTIFLPDGGFPNALHACNVTLLSQYTSTATEKRIGRVYMIDNATSGAPAACSATQLVARIHLNGLFNGGVEVRASYWAVGR